MRVPTDRPLAVWLRQLIRKDKLYLFYQTEEWKDLRAEVLEDLHHECQCCLAKGEYVRADCVHHVREVRQFPSLALSKWYVDEKGERHRNLLPLCNTCHNIIHDKLGKHRDAGRFTNEERW